jgi:hypothetical protein
LGFVSIAQFRFHQALLHLIVIAQFRFLSGSAAPAMAAPTGTIDRNVLFLFYPYHIVSTYAQNGLQTRLLFASSATTPLGLIQLRSSLEEELFWHVHTPWI